MKKNLLVIGGGGHAKVVIDIALCSGEWLIAGVLDDAVKAAGKSVLGCAVIGGTERMADFSGRGTAFVVAIGANEIRERLQEKAIAAGLVAATLIHPSAVLAGSVVIGEGSVLMARAVINADTKIGKGVVVNTGAVIEHDCLIGDFCHVAPGVTLCGSVSVGPRSLIGVGSCVVPGVTIGSDCVIGAGAAVVGPVASRVRVVGVPARATRG